MLFIISSFFKIKENIKKLDKTQKRVVQYIILKLLYLGGNYESI